MSDACSRSGCSGCRKCRQQARQPLLQTGQADEHRQTTRVPAASLRILAVEFNERLGFYGAVFSFTTYITVLLQQSAVVANITVNALYTLSPVASMLGAHLADGSWGRPRTLLVAGLLYTTGMALVACSAIPSVWTSFPSEPSKYTFALFYAGIAVLSLGFGSLKVCTGPLMADAVTAANPGDCECTMLSSLFRWMYWVVNLGGMIGILAGPMVRGLTGPRIEDHDGSLTTGYWASFTMCAGAAVVGLLVFVSGYATYPRREPRKTASYIGIVFTSLWRHITNRDARQPGKSFVYAYLYDPKHPNKYDVESENTVVTVEDTLKACKIFLVMPLYWLIGNQFSTNFIIQVGWLKRPSILPPEAFNNINTFALLLFLPVFDRCILPAIYGARRPPLVKRIVIGFFCSIVSMLYAGALQLFLMSSGTFTNGEYIPHDNHARLSAWWVVPPYVIMGMASVLVDTAASEAAYILAPPTAKSLVSSLFLVASAVSGLLGIALSPLSQPHLFVYMFFLLALLLSIATVVFYQLFKNLDEIYDMANAPPGDEVAPTTHTSAALRDSFGRRTISYVRSHHGHRASDIGNGSNLRTSIMAV